jgi:hypothetical protein
MKKLQTGSIKLPDSQIQKRISLIQPLSDENQT